MSSSTQAPTPSSSLTAVSNSKAPPPRPMWRIVLGQFFEHRAGVAGLGMIVLLVLVALAAPLFSAYLETSPETPNILHRFVGFGGVVEAPQDRQEDELEAWLEAHKKEGAELIAAIKTNKLLSDEVLLEYSEDEEELPYALLELTTKPEGLEALRAQKDRIPALAAFLTFKESFRDQHLLGTDELGRDVLMRLIYGARVTIGVGLLVAFIAGLAGLMIGCLAGYYGGFVDTALMRVTDALLSLPLLPILIIFAAIDLREVPFFEFLVGSRSESVFKMVVILCGFSWMTTARVVRGNVLSLRSREFVLAARTVGAGDLRIILTHIVPNVIAPFLVAVTLNVGNAILWEAALSFLGLGIQPPLPSWGNMLTNAQELMHQAPALSVLPGLCIFVAVISFNFVGDGLQDAVDPKAIRR